MSSVGNAAVLRALVEHGADLRLADDREFTVALVACCCGKPDVLRYLASRGVVDVERAFPSGLVPFHVACAMGKLAVVKFFATERGADVNSFYGHHSTPLLVALLGGEADVVRCEACLRGARTVNGISLTRAFARVIVVRPLFAGFCLNMAPMSPAPSPTATLCLGLRLAGQS